MYAARGSRRAVRANTAQLVPSSLNFHKFFALAPVPLTGCTGALMRFSRRPSEKLFHHQQLFPAQTSSCSLGCSEQIAIRLGSGTNVFEDSQVTNFLIRGLLYGSPEGAINVKRTLLIKNNVLRHIQHIKWGSNFIRNLSKVTRTFFYISGNFNCLNFESSLILLLTNTELTKNILSQNNEIGGFNFLLYSVNRGMKASLSQKYHCHLAGNKSCVEMGHLQLFSPLSILISPGSNRRAP